MFTIAIVSLTAGMFAKQAVNKLSDVFNSIFKSDKEATATGKLADEVEHPVPELLELKPAEGEQTQDQKIAITGHKFVRESVVFVNDIFVNEKELKHTFVNSENISLVIPATVLAGKEKLIIKVLNPPPSGGQSNQLEFKIKPKT